MNYKQTQQFNERKIMVLMMLANRPLDLDDMGTLVPIKQIEYELGIKGKTLYRCLHSLENDGVIINTHRGYETGVKSMRWLITDEADKIINDENNILKFHEMIHDYYKTLNENRVTAKLSKNEDDNIGYIYINYNILINKINDLMELNNGFSKIKSKSRLRIENGKIKGRVFNDLCFQKSGKKQRYMKSDKRLLRTEYLNYKGLPEYKEIFDIKSQIPRLTYILQGGNYDDIADFYVIDGFNVKGLNKETTRSLVKDFFMSTYFDKSEKAGAWHLYRSFLFDKINRVNRQDPEFVEIAKEYFYRDFGIVWNYFRNLFTPIGSEIFLWTSLWEQLIIKEARERLGVHIVNVYDGFYYNDYSIKDALNKIAGETSAEVRRLYTEIKNMETAELNVA